MASEEEKEEQQSKTNQQQNLERSTILTQQLLDLGLKQTGEDLRNKIEAKGSYKKVPRKW